MNSDLKKQLALKIKVNIKYPQIHNPILFLNLFI